MALLEITSVSKSYGSGDEAVFAVKDVSLTAEAGEFIVLLGPSGSGKTTLLAMIGALLTPDEGEIAVDGTAISGLSQRERERFRRSTVGFVFQANNLLNHLTVLENLLYVAEIEGLPRQVAQQRADELIETLDLTIRKNGLAERLSGGERQRTAIARAFMNDPTLLLLDEPTASLDSERAQSLLGLLIDVVKRRGKVAIAVSHDPRVAERADRVLTLKDGSIVEER